MVQRRMANKNHSEELLRDKDERGWVGCQVTWPCRHPYAALPPSHSFNILFNVKNTWTPSPRGPSSIATYFMCTCIWTKAVENTKRHRPVNIDKEGLNSRAFQTDVHSLYNLSPLDSTPLLHLPTVFILRIGSFSSKCYQQRPGLYNIGFQPDN